MPRVRGHPDPSHATPMQIAMQSGDADQAHMRRAVRAPTGAPPSRWRSISSSFKTLLA